METTGIKTSISSSAAITKEISIKSTIAYPYFIEDNFFLVFFGSF